MLQHLKIRSIFPECLTYSRILPREGWIMWTVKLVCAYNIKSPYLQLPWPGEEPPERSEIFKRLALDFLGKTISNPWGDLKNRKRIEANRKILDKAFGNTNYFVDAVINYNTPLGWDLIRKKEGKYLLGIHRNNEIDAVSVIYPEKHRKLLLNLAIAKSIAKREIVLQDIRRECLTVASATSVDAYRNFIGTGFDGTCIVANESKPTWIIETLLPNKKIAA